MVSDVGREMSDLHRTEVGIRYPDGSIYNLGDPHALPDAGSYHTNEEYAAIRARVVGGEVVWRKIVTTISVWEERDE